MTKHYHSKQHLCKTPDEHREWDAHGSSANYRHFKARNRVQGCVQSSHRSLQGAWPTPTSTRASDGFVGCNEGSS